jgi:Cys-tRNA(Pro)/Cys-tRNA(Cys) deacylase
VPLPTWARVCLPGGFLLTSAIRFLEKHGIPFEVAEYEHLEKGAVFAARALGLPVDRTIKTLVVEVVPGGYYLVLMPGNKTISFRRLAKVLGAKRAAMVDTDTAERLTGYLVGGISPFGVRKQLPVLMEADLLAFDKVAINGGRRGVMLVMNPSDIVRTMRAETVVL